MILNSIYEGRPGTIFFQYPSQCDKIRDTSRIKNITQFEEQAYNLKYRNDNKEAIKKYQTTKTKCKHCGFICQHQHIKTHQKSKKCLLTRQHILSQQEHQEPQQDIEEEPQEKYHLLFNGFIHNMIK